MKTINEIHESDHQALFEELEARYGSAVAQGIIDQIRKVEAPDLKGTPDYMAVKACSEMLELFRGEAQVGKRIQTYLSAVLDINETVLPPL